MTNRPLLLSPSWLIVLLVSLAASTGCTALKVPALQIPSVSLPSVPGLKASGSDTPYSGVEAQTLVGSQSADTYQKIKQAKAQNAIVLQVANDSVPVRVLPLPGGGKSVFVSELLSQTGLLTRLGSRTHAVLHRPSPDSLSGIKMEIKLNQDGDAVATACDYALRPGDRIVISKSESTGMQELVNLVLQR